MSNIVKHLSTTPLAQQPSGRKPAKSALRFLYRQVLKNGEPWLTDVAAARQGKHLPVVLAVAELLKVSALWLVVGDGAAPKLFFQAGICRVSRTPCSIDSRTFAARRLHSVQCVLILPPESPAGKKSSWTRYFSRQWVMGSGSVTPSRDDFYGEWNHTIASTIT
jgi:hypothetical protein